MKHNIADRYFDYMSILDEAHDRFFTLAIVIFILLGLPGWIFLFLLATLMRLGKATRAALTRRGI